MEEDSLQQSKPWLAEQAGWKVLSHSIGMKVPLTDSDRQLRSTESDGTAKRKDIDRKGGEEGG